MIGNVNDRNDTFFRGYIQNPNSITIFIIESTAPIYFDFLRKFKEKTIT